MKKVVNQCGFAAANVRKLMEAECASTARSINARDVSRCARYQLTASGALAV
jgi:hypothetical protein